MENDGFHTVRGYELLDQRHKRLTSAMEDYLEMICRGEGSGEAMHINRLAQLLHVKASSVTKMVQKLGIMGLVQYEKYEVVVLTDAGRRVGRRLLARHQVLEDFLRLLGTDRDLLTQTELIEHNISPETLKNIEMLNLFFTANPEIRRRYEAYCRGEEPPGEK
jgi:Mn-dependent DtxR family transcriptional regulator